MHFCFAFVSRMWDMGVVLLVADLTNNSLFFVALANLFGALGITFLMPSIGKYLDRTDRLEATSTALLLKVSAVSIVYIGCAGSGSTAASTSATSTLDDDGNSDPQLPFFVLYLLPIFVAIAAVTFKTITTAVEKDWIVVLSAKNTEWLAETNSVMTQIDLGCSSVAPAVTGFLFSTFSYSLTAIILLVTNGLSVLMLYMFLRFLYNSWPALHSRKSPPEGDAKSNESSTNSGSDGAMSSSVANFFSSGCAGVMLSYAFLYLTVLSFGAIMTVYCRWAGISDHWIGIFRGFNALFGFLGATIFPRLKANFGLIQTGFGAIWYQFALVFCAAASMYVYSVRLSTWIIMYAVLFSRSGLWVFDLCARQIVQETLPEDTRGSVNGLWASIISFFNMSSFVMSMINPDPREFIVLTTISAMLVGLGKSFVFVFVFVFALACSLCFSLSAGRDGDFSKNNTDIMSLNCIEDALII